MLPRSLVDTRDNVQNETQRLRDSGSGRLKIGAGMPRSNGGGFVTVMTVETPRAENMRTEARVGQPPPPLAEVLYEQPHSGANLEGCDRGPDRHPAAPAGRCGARTAPNALSTTRDGANSISNRPNPESPESPESLLPRENSPSRLIVSARFRIDQILRSPETLVGPHPRQTASRGARLDFQTTEF